MSILQQSLQSVFSAEYQKAKNFRYYRKKNVSSCTATTHSKTMFILRSSALSVLLTLLVHPKSVYVTIPSLLTVWYLVLCLLSSVKCTLYNVSSSVNSDIWFKCDPVLLLVLLWIFFVYFSWDLKLFTFTIVFSFFIYLFIY